MKDRVVQFPNRYKLTPVSGDIYDLTPEPGIVTEPGTDLNKANLLKDTTAALYGLDSEAVPDEVFAALASRAKITIGSYTGTGTYGASNPNSLTFDFAPKLLILFDSVGAMYQTDMYSNYFNYIGRCDVLTTEYVQRALWGIYYGSSMDYKFYNYAKKSADGKTIYWYMFYTYRGTVQDGSRYQANKSGEVYNYLAIG